MHTMNDIQKKTYIT